MNIIVEAFHFIPLLIIIGIFCTQFTWKVFKKQTLVLQQIDPLLLILSAIGTAAGANAHGHEFLNIAFDPCFGYAAVSMCVAAKMLGIFKRFKQAHA